MKKLLSALALALIAATSHANTCTIRQANSTDQTVYVTFLDATTGVPTAGLAFNSSGIDIEYVRTGAAAVDITEATQTANGAHSDGGFVSVGHGRYRLDLPDAAVASGVPEVVIQGIITGYIMAPCSVALSPPVNVVSTGTDAITATSIASDAIGAAEVANGAIDAATFASGAIDATAIAADAIGASELATDAIGSAELAADSITSSEIATDAIGAAELAANSITSSEVADDSIDAGAIAANALTTAEIATGAISSDEVADNAIDAGAIADGAVDDASFATTAGAFNSLGIVDQGTAQAATSTTLQLRSAAAFADDEIIGATCIVTGGSAGVGQSRTITDYVSSTDTATVATWTTTPTGTITYKCFGTAEGAAGGGSLTAADVWAYSTRILTALDEDTTTIDLNATAIGSIATGGISSTTFASGAIDASAIAADAIGASEIAADAIGASEIATDAVGAAEIAASAIGASEIADGGITSTEFGTGAITATVIAADAIGASELAADAIGASELAADAITSSEVADGAIDAGALATDTITSAKIAADAITNSELAATAASEIADQTWEEAIGDHSATVGSTAEALSAAGGGGATDQELGILRQGTAQSATSTTLVMDTGASFGDDTAIGMTLIACGSTQGYCQARTVNDNVNSTDTLTVSAWTVTPSGTITFYLFGTAPGAGGGLDAAGVRAAIGMASANLDTQLGAIDDAVDTEVSAIKTKTDQLNFTVTGEVDANTKSMNDEEVCGTGDPGSAWKGCP